MPRFAKGENQKQSGARNTLGKEARAPAIPDQEAAIAPDVMDSVVSTIVQNCDPEMIALFGSAATGRTHQDSDLDLLVVMDSTLPRPQAGRPDSPAVLTVSLSYGHPGVHAGRNREVAGNDKPYRDRGPRVWEGLV